MSAVDALSTQARTLERVQHVLHRYPIVSPLVVLLVATIVFAIWSDGRLVEPPTLGIAMQQTAVVGALAIGQTLIVLTAGIDLAIGTAMLLTHLIVAKTAADNGVPPLLALGLGLVVGLLIGLFHGVLVTKIGLPPFIATLGTFFAWQAVGLVYSKARTIPKEELGGTDGLLLWPGKGLSIGSMRITTGVIIAFALYLVFWYILGNTAWGRHVYAVGDDPEAARLAGINVTRVVISVYVVAGLIYGLGGWIQLGRSLSASANAATDVNLATITAVVIGGTSLFGGRGRDLGNLDRGAHRDGVLARPQAVRCRRLLREPGHRPADHRCRCARSVDSQGRQMSTTDAVLSASGLVKRFGRVTALNGADLDLYPGEVLAVIGDNGAGKSSLIKCLSGAMIPDEGTMTLDGEPIAFRLPSDAQAAGIETVYQTLAVAPALDIATNMFLGRERLKPGVLGSVFRMVDTSGMRRDAKAALDELGIGTLQDIGQAVETLSGGQRQAVAVARAAAFGSKLVILDEPTAALGVRESGQVLQLIRDLRDRGLPVILISHNMPHVFDVADRIHIQRLGRRVATVTPQSHTMAEAVAIMTGAAEPDPAVAG